MIFLEAKGFGFGVTNFFTPPSPKALTSFVDSPLATDTIQNIFNQ
jgi:hypothetical protein